jgi:hypothetical protein
MPGMSTPKQPKRPRDVNQLAKAIVEQATGETQPQADVVSPVLQLEIDLIHAAAKALGRRGGLKGGKARASSLTPERRAEIAKKAAEKRWGKSGD